MNIDLPRLKQAFLFVLPIAFFVALIAIWQPAPSNAQRRKTAQQPQAGVAGWTEEADRLAEANNWPEAINAYRRVLSQHPKSVEAFKGLGDALLNTGRWEEALAAYKEAVRIAPNDAEAQFDLGYCYNTMGRHGEAYAPLQRAYTLDQGLTEAYYGIGYAYLRSGQYEKALPFLKGTIRSNPEFTDAYYSLALAYGRLGKFELAREPRKKLLDLNPNLIAKLDKEIQTPPSALAGPLPTPVPPRASQTEADGQSKTADVSQNRPSPDPQPQTREVTPQADADTIKPTTPSEQPIQEQPAYVGSTQVGTQPPITRDLPNRQDTATTTPQLPQPKADPVKPVIAPQPSPTPAPLPAPLNAATQPTAPATEPAITSPVAAWPNKAKRWALVIGVDNYSEDQAGGSKSATNDARTFADALVQYADFPAHQVILLSADQPSQNQPRRATIIQQLESLRGRVPKDGLLLVSFAGHGFEHNGRSYLLPSDAPIDDPSLFEDTAVNVNKVIDSIRATGVKQVLLVLDASRNDPAPGRADSDNPLTSSFSRSFTFDLNRREVTAFATLYATAVGQRAYEYSLKKQGFFTWALIEGLRGEAANGKGEVTLASLLKYVQENVPKYVQSNLGASKQQKPFAVVEGYNADELVIAVAKKSSP